MIKKHYPLLLLFFFFVAVILTYPAIFHLSDKLIGDGGDNYQSFGFQFIASEKIRHLEYPFSQTNIFRYPVGFSFENGFESVLAVLTGGFLSLFLNNILSYNLTVLFLLSLNGILSFLLFRYISKSYFIGIIGAVIYGYSSFVIARTAGHLNLFFVGGFPLFVYALLRLKDDFTLRNIALLFSAFTLIFLGSFQYSLLFFISLIICFPLLFFFFPNIFKHVSENFFKKTTRILLISIPFLLMFALFFYPYLHTFLTGDFFKPDRNNSAYLLQNSPSIRDFVLPNSYLRLQITEFVKNLTDGFKSIERVVFVGFIELFLFILFIGRYKDKRLKYFILSLVLIFYILSLGFINPESKIHLPYFFIHSIFPFSFIDEPARFFVIFYLFLTTGIVLELKQMYGKSIKTLAFFALIIILITLERLPFNYWLSSTFLDDSYVQAVKKEEGTAVLDIPVTRSNSLYDNTVYDILPYVYGKKIVSGNFQWFADTKKTKSFIEKSGLTRFMCGFDSKIEDEIELENKKLIEVLKLYNIRSIVVHKNDPKDHGKYYFPDCVSVRRQTSILLPQLFMPNPTEKVQVLDLFFPVVPFVGDTIVFPSQGSFFIDGLNAYPIDHLPLAIFLDEREIQINQNWKEVTNTKIASLEPILKIDVQKGTKIRFQFGKNHNQDYSFVKLWYRYETKESVPQVDATGQIIKIYEDTDAAVFRIR